MNSEERKKRFLLLQINDALFPVGAYSHSYGLETYIQKGLVKTAAQAGEYLSSRLQYSFCSSELLAARLAWEAAGEGQLEKILRIEEILCASLTPKEVREASLKLGSRFVKTVKRMELTDLQPVFEAYCSVGGQQKQAYAVAYGVFCGAAGISCEDAMLHYLYAQSSAIVTNCVKTIPLSQMDGQRLLSDAQGLYQKVLNRLEQLTEDDLCLAAPGFDVRCMQHETLYSRIYMS